MCPISTVYRNYIAHTEILAYKHQMHAYLSRGVLLHVLGQASFETLLWSCTRVVWGWSIAKMLATNGFIPILVLELVIMIIMWCNE